MTKQELWRCYGVFPTPLRSTFGVDPLDRQTATAAARSDWERGKVRGVKGSPHFFSGDHDWFCPTLLIRHEGEAFNVQIAQERMRDFYSTALG